LTQETGVFIYGCLIKFLPYLSFIAFSLINLLGTVIKYLVLLEDKEIKALENFAKEHNSKAPDGKISTHKKRLLLFV
jgi:hypothetical protein